MLNLELGTEVFKFFVIELSAILNDDDLRKAKSIDNGLPHKLSSLSFSDLGYRLNFHPFGKVVDGYK